MTVNEDYVRERLTAYISPRAPTTQAEQDAFENAVVAQTDYETANSAIGAASGVASISNDGVSVSFDTSRSSGGSYSMQTISPAAYAYLYNAGLIRYSLPTARRL
jgi:hypothetical protein